MPRPARTVATSKKFADISAHESAYVPCGQSMQSVTEQISNIVLTRPTGPGWLGAFASANALTLLLAPWSFICY